MQIFVLKAALAGTDPIGVLANYPDTPWVARDTHGDQATPLGLPGNQVMFPMPGDSSTGNTLSTNFRDRMADMANGEAARRANEVFPDFMQRNANADINSSTMKYGADPSTWPPDAQDRKAEGDRGWNYIAALRQSADAMASQPTTVDPTDDSHWPTVIDPIYIPPVVS